MTSRQLADRARVVRPSALQAQPWRNGGGTTRELAVAPADGHPSPAWRVSLATIATDGPFSTFPGVERSLLLLSKTRLRLDVDGAVTELSRHEVLDFPGEASVGAQIAGATSEVLNLLQCRACSRGSWELRSHDGPELLSGADGPVLVLLEGSATLDGRQLEPHDVVLLAATPSPVTFRSARTAVLGGRSTVLPPSPGP